MLNSGYEFISPEYTYKEIINHIDLIEKKSNIRVSNRCSEFCEAIRGSLREGGTDKTYNEASKRLNVV